MSSSGAAPVPHYLRMKRDIAGRVAAGVLRPGERVASESELVRAFGVSRMTANRALRELAAEGVIRREAGVGSFVAERPSTVLKLRPIADEIAARSHVHAVRVRRAEILPAPGRVSRALALPPRSPVFHTLILHLDDTVPLQLEARYVRADAAPDYLGQDFAVVAAEDYLSSVAPFTDVTHMVEAIMPGRSERKLLEMEKGTPCLRFVRCAWSGARAITCAWLTHPADRFRLASDPAPDAAPA